jgi:hypothetical protein
MTEGEDSSGKVHQYRRRKLEPEIVAMSVETEEDDQPTVIINIDDPAAKPAIRKVIVLVGAAFGGLAELIRNLAREHSTVAAVATTAVAAVTATAVIPPVLDDDRHSPPPIAIERVVTLSASSRPAETVTATITRDPQPSAAAPTKPARSASAEPAALRTRLPTPDPTRSIKTSSPVKTPARKSHTPAPQASDDEPVVALPVTTPTRQPPGDTPTPEPQPSPVSDPPSQEPTVAAAGCGGIIHIHVDVNPQMDVCVLG